jgi:hypothetical protein
MNPHRDANPLTTSLPADSESSVFRPQNDSNHESGFRTWRIFQGEPFSGENPGNLSRALGLLGNFLDRHLVEMLMPAPIHLPPRRFNLPKNVDDPMGGTHVR